MHSISRRGSWCSPQAAPALAARTDLVLGMPLEPPHLDPTAGAAAAIDEVVYANVFEGLTRIGPNGEVLPALAESWTISDDGKTYTFKLHTGVKFHDGTRLQRRGREVLARPGPRRQFDQCPEGAVCRDRDGRGRRPGDRQGDAEEPAGLLPLQYGLGRRRHRGAGERRDQQGKADRHRPVQVRQLGQGLVDHPRPRPTATGATRCRSTRPSSASCPTPPPPIPALLSGDVQAFPFFQPGDALAQIQADPRFKVVIGSTEGETILSINNKKPPFDNSRCARRSPMHSTARRSSTAPPPGSAADRLAFRAAQPGLCRPDRHLSARRRRRPRRCSRRPGCENGFKATLKLPPPALCAATAARSSRRSCARSASTSRSSRWNGPTGWSRCSPTRTTT